MNEMNFDAMMNQEPTEQISVTDLDAALIKVRDLECKYEDAHAISSTAYKELGEAEQELIKLMKAAGKDRWEIRGVKGFSMKTVFKYKVPASPDQREKLFNFMGSEIVSQLLQQPSRDIVLAYTTCNHNSLQTFCNKLLELKPDLQIEGVDAPVAEQRLISLRKVT